jgi:hypothetical protein
MERKQLVYRGNPPQAIQPKNGEKKSLPTGA